MQERVGADMEDLLRGLPSFRQRFERDAPEISRDAGRIRIIVAFLDKVLTDYLADPPADGAGVERFCEEHLREFDSVPDEERDMLFDFFADLSETFYGGPAFMATEDVEGPMDDYILYCRNLYALCAGDPIKTLEQFQNPQKYGS